MFERAREKDICRAFCSGARQGTGGQVVLTEQNELLAKEKEFKRKGTKAAARVLRDPQVPPQPSFLDHSAHPPEAQQLEPPPALWDYAFPLHAMAIGRAKLLHFIGCYTPLRTLDVRDFLKV